jgi:hypothetical protein
MLACLAQFGIACAVVALAYAFDVHQMRQRERKARIARRLSYVRGQ